MAYAPRTVGFEFEFSGLEELLGDRGRGFLRGFTKQGAFTENVD